MNLLKSTKKAQQVINELGLSQSNINLIAQIIKNCSDGLNIDDSFKLALRQQDEFYKHMDSPEGMRQLKEVLGL